MNRLEIKLGWIYLDKKIGDCFQSRRCSISFEFGTIAISNEMSNFFFLSSNVACMRFFAVSYCNINFKNESTGINLSSSGVQQICTLTENII